MKAWGKRAILFVVALLAAAPVFALSVIPSDRSPQEQLINLASAHRVIVRGIVGQSSRPYYGRYFAFPDADNVILTNREIAVEEVLKGPVISVLNVQSPGGCIDDRCLRTDIAPPLFEGSGVVLFLEPASDGKYVIKDIISGTQIESAGLFYPLGVDLEAIKAAVEQGAE